MAVDTTIIYMLGSGLKDLPLSGERVLSLTIQVSGSKNANCKQMYLLIYQDKHFVKNYNNSLKQETKLNWKRLYVAVYLISLKDRVMQ